MQSELFNRIATELCDAERILARIKARGRHSRNAAEAYVAPHPERAAARRDLDRCIGPRPGGHPRQLFPPGGHSLLGTQVISRIRDAFAVGLPLHVLFQLPTIAQLASRLDVSSRDASLPPITPVDRTKPLPLSFAQQRLWFLDRLEGKSATYNIVAAVRLDGHLDLQTLERSLETLVARHDSPRPCRRCPCNTWISPTGSGNGLRGKCSTNNSRTGKSNSPARRRYWICPATIRARRCSAIAGRASPFRSPMN